MSDDKDTAVDDGIIGVGRPPENWRQAMYKAGWMLLNMIYLVFTIEDLTGSHHSAAERVFGWTGLGVFLAGYSVLLLVRRPRVRRFRARLLLLAGLYGLVLLLLGTLGGAFLPLLVYVTISCGVMLPLQRSVWVVPLAALIALGLAALRGTNAVSLFVVGSAALTGGLAMAGVAQMGRTMRELREARNTVARLAANEERLRLARDLHDLLGHSLSLITLKSELAGRMLPGQPEQAARQVADIEQVSRQALQDVRAAVSGFRRPTLDAELAGAHTALAAAGIVADLSRAPAAHPDLPPDAEGALAWALREAVTNVARHSGARRCEVVLAESADELWLTVTDDGHGPVRTPGNGLTGLAERLALIGGRLETGRAPRGGFRLRACAPLTRRAAPEVLESRS